MTRRADLPFTSSSYGLSRRGIPLECIPPQGRCRTLVIAGIHGEEPETTVILSRALRCLDMVPPSCACVLAANPDGLLLGSRGNAAGVDLNRNFPAANWQAEPTACRWHVDDSDDDLLPIGTGEEPGSEPETAALIALIESLAPSRVVALHSPLACIDDPESTPAGRWLAEKSGLPLVNHIGYPTPGSLGSWAAERALPVITWEFPRLSIEELSRCQAPVLRELLAKEDFGS